MGPGDSELSVCHIDQISEGLAAKLGEGGVALSYVLNKGIIEPLLQFRIIPLGRE